MREKSFKSFLLFIFLGGLMSKKSLTYGIDILSGAAAGYDNV